MERRPYGSTGVDLSLVGMGGIVVSALPQAEADRLVAEAVDNGVNYFDVAPSYGDAEERLGPALEPYREGVFLACKTAERRRDGAEAELRSSLRNLRTDHFDLYQLHGLASVEEVEMCFGPGGAMEAVLRAREAGLVRYLGLSAHSEAAALAALGHGIPFDSVLFPFHYATYYRSDFGARVLAGAEAAGVARLALKAMARGPWPDGADRSAYSKCWYEPLTVPDEAEMALRWTLSLPITAAIPPGEAPLFRMAVRFAQRFRPMTDEERAAIQARALSSQPLFS